MKQGVLLLQQCNISAPERWDNISYCFTLIVLLWQINFIKLRLIRLVRVFH
jgi:hypothetical protein